VLGFLITTVKRKKCFFGRSAHEKCSFTVLRIPCIILEKRLPIPHVMGTFLRCFGSRSPIGSGFNWASGSASRYGTALWVLKKGNIEELN
jgi:hypothetical protein